MERWAKPAVVLDVEEHPTQVYDMPDGRVFGGVKLTVSRETAERMRLGRMCAVCLQPFEQAWPEQCPFCGVRVREQQALYFEQMYEGVEEIPTTEWDVEGTEQMRELLLAHEEEERDGG